MENKDDKIELVQSEIQNKQYPDDKMKFDNNDDDVKVNTEMTCYESILNCCGDVMGFFGGWCQCICFCCPNPYKMIEYSNVGLIQRFGKFQKVLQDGMHPVNPMTENIILINMKTQIISLPRQYIFTKDNITANIDTVVYYRIIDPVRSTYRLRSIESAVQEATTSCLRAVCGDNDFQTIIEHREKIADDIENFLEKELQKWGIFVEQVFIKDMIVNEDLQKQLSSAAKARRLGESKVISAKSDVEAAKLLREAADILDSDAAMQMRYFECVQQFKDNQAPKIMFLPLLNKEFEQQGQGQQKKK